MRGGLPYSLNPRPQRQSKGLTVAYKEGGVTVVTSPYAPPEAPLSKPWATTSKPATLGCIVAAYAAGLVTSGLIVLIGFRTIYPLILDWVSLDSSGRFDDLVIPTGDAMQCFSQFLGAAAAGFLTCQFLRTKWQISGLVQFTLFTVTWLLAREWLPERDPYGYPFIAGLLGPGDEVGLLAPLAAILVGACFGAFTGRSTPAA